MKIMNFVKKTNADIKKAIAVIFMIFAQTLFFGCDIDYEVNDVNITIPQECLDSLDEANIKMKAKKGVAKVEFKTDIEYVSKVDMTIEEASITIINPMKRGEVTIVLKEGLSFSKSDTPVSTKAHVLGMIKELKNTDRYTSEVFDVIFKAVIDGKEYDIDLKNATREEVEAQFKDLRIGFGI